MRRHLAVTAALALLGAAACSKPAPVPADELQQDLARANGSGLELAPHAGGLQVVSDAELTPAPQPQRSFKAAPTPERRPTPRPTPRATQVAAAPEPQPEAPPAPVPTPEATVPPAPETVDPMPAPRPHPAEMPQQSRRRGGYSSVSDVIRNAPFPITP